MDGHPTIPAILVRAPRCWMFLTGTQMTICVKKCQKGGGYAVLCALLFLRCVFFEGYNGKMMMNHQISGLQIPSCRETEAAHPQHAWVESSRSAVFPHIMLWGSIFSKVHSRRPRPPPHTALSHTGLSQTQLSHTHTTLSHTHTRTQTQLCHTELCHTQLFHTQNFVTDSFVTDNFVTHDFSTHNSFTTLSRTQLCHAFGDMHSRRGTYSTGLALVARLVARGQLWRRGLLHCRRGTCWHARSLCVAGVAFCDVYVPFTQQAWHFGDIDGAFVRQAWHVLALTCLLCGRCGSWW